MVVQMNIVVYTGGLVKNIYASPVGLDHQTIRLQYTVASVLTGDGVRLWEVV